MEFIQDYLLYNSGNECPNNYHRWVALSILASAVTRRVGIHQGYFIVRPNLYIGLIGSQGSRKTTAADIGRDLFLEAIPDHPIGSSTQTVQDIVRYMSSNDCNRVFTNHEGVKLDYRPFTLFVNEFKNFLAINPAATIAFLTDIYDREIKFDSRTIKRGLEDIPRPCVNLLCCETPEWIINNLKSNIISGGFTRRIIYIYETDETIRIPFPEISNEMKEARRRCVEHLRSLQTVSGMFEWHPDAKKFFSDWYMSVQSPDDKIMAGYYKSKHIQLQKVAMLLCLSERQPKLLLTKDSLELGLAFLDVVEKNMPKLSVAAGRNELALPQQNALELLDKNNGWMLEKEWKRQITKDLSPNEIHSMIMHLKSTEEIVVRDWDYYNEGKKRMVVFTPRKYLEEGKKQLEAKK